jgi:hypothetical protein
MLHMYLSVRLKSKNVAHSFHAARHLLRQGMLKTITQFTYLSIWAALSKNVEKRCGGASCLPGYHAWLPFFAYLRAVFHLNKI